MKIAQVSPLFESVPPTCYGGTERDPYYLKTNIPGLFAAGDVRQGAIKRCASAVGEGSMAVAFVNRYLSSC